MKCKEVWNREETAVRRGRLAASNRIQVRTESVHRVNEKGGMDEAGLVERENHEPGCGD